MSTTIKKHIGFPKDLFQILEINAGIFGVSVPEYIRFLVINDQKNMLHKEEMLKIWESHLPDIQFTKQEQKSLTIGIKEHEKMQKKGEENHMSANEIMKNIS